MSVFFLVDLGFLTVPASYFAVADDYSHLPLFVLLLYWITWADPLHLTSCYGILY